MKVPKVRFAPSNGAELAYQVWGEGPPTIVAIPPLAQNIELAWEWPGIRHMLERWGALGRYLHYDKRGTGASEAGVDVPNLDQRVDDLRAVMDHAGVGQAVLFGVSGGGPTALLFAATYPDRVERVVLESTAARLGDPDRTLTEENRARMELFISVWGTPETLTPDLFAPSLAGDPAFRAWHERYERQSAGRSALRELMVMNGRMDVREVLGEVRCPVLMLHRADDGIVPIELARETAAALPEARLAELEGRDHFTYATDLDPFFAEVEEFLGGAAGSSVIPQRPSVAIRTLGGFEVEVGGEEVPVGAWGSKRARQLVKRLVAARGWPVTRDELCDLLWPDGADPERIGARLSVQLSTARRVLRGGIVADRSTVRLDPDEVDTDLRRFFEATEDEAILAAYAGEFLPGDRFEDWSGPVRDEARARFVSAAHRLLSTADAERAVDLATRILVEDRFDQAAHESLAGALDELGRHGQAAIARDRYRSAMAEIGVIP